MAATMKTAPKLEVVERRSKHNRETEPYRNDVPGERQQCALRVWLVQRADSNAPVAASYLHEPVTASHHGQPDAVVPRRTI